MKEESKRDVASLRSLAWSDKASRGDDERLNSSMQMPLQDLILLILRPRFTRVTVPAIMRRKMTARGEKMRFLETRRWKIWLSWIIARCGGSWELPGKNLRRISRVERSYQSCRGLWFLKYRFLGLWFEVFCGPGALEARTSILEAVEEKWKVLSVFCRDQIFLTLFFGSGLVLCSGPEALEAKTSISVAREEKFLNLEGLISL